MNDSSKPLIKRHQVGFLEGPNGEVWFRFRNSISMFAPDNSREGNEILIQFSLTTLHELLTDTLSRGHASRVGSTFLFGDLVLVLDEVLFGEDSKCLR